MLGELRLLRSELLTVAQCLSKTRSDADIRFMSVGWLVFPQMLVTLLIWKSKTMAEIISVLVNCVCTETSPAVKFGWFHHSYTRDFTGQELLHSCPSCPCPATFSPSLPAPSALGTPSFVITEDHRYTVWTEAQLPCLCQGGDTPQDPAPSSRHASH